MNGMMLHVLRTALVAAALTAAAGCDYFKPTDPEPPAENQVAADYSTADATLETLRLAVESKGQGGAAQSYLGAFADSTLHPEIHGFHQFFDPADEAAWTGTVPSDWNLSNERNFFNVGEKALVALRPETYQMFLERDPFNADREQDKSTLLHRRYTILAIGQTGDVADVIARGFADLTLEQAANGFWYISRWEDRRDPDPFNPDFPQVTLGQRRLEY
jgi:hypothetical protein